MAALNNDKEQPLTLEAVYAAIDSRLKAGVSGALDEFKNKALPGMFSTMFTEQLSPITTQIAQLVEKMDKGQGTGTGTGTGTGVTGTGTGQGAGFSPEANAKIIALENSLKNVTKELTGERDARVAASKKAETAEKQSAIRTALGQDSLSRLAPKAKSTAFTLIEPHVRRLEDGSFVAGQNGDNLPLDVFAKEFLEREHDYLFVSNGQSGSGAGTNGGSSAGGGTGVRADIDTINPGMSDAVRSAAAQSILAALQNA